MSDPAGSGRRSSDGASSNLFPNLLSELLSDMSDSSDMDSIMSDPFHDYEESDSSSDTTPPENQADDFDLFVDSNVGEGYYVALFLQRIIARYVGLLTPRSTNKTRKRKCIR